MSKYPPSSFAPYAALGAPAQFSPTPTTAEVRSQAAARLKRAAFLPRNPENRRPSQNSQDDQIHQTPEEGEAGPSSLTIHPIHYDAEEVLSPSPIAGTSNHSALSPPMATGMQRSASSSSSYHIPTPPYMIYGQTYGTPYYSNTSSRSGTPDWSSMQLAQTYIPSLSPAGMPASPFMPTTGTSVLGRNTPSPLPTLGELRTLSRSNSAAARARAMEKLTGGKETPSDEDHTIQAFFSRPNLQRADSLGAPRVLDLAMSRATRGQPAEEPSIAEPTESRPRLQRSFTVSSTNMGEERRSAVGRRMVERLAKSKAAKDEVEVQDEVRQLWEQRRGVPQEFERSEEYGSPAENETTMMQLVETPIPSESPRPEERRVIEGKHLAPPDRSASQNTMRSGEEAFEYEAHLRRSLSSRTARGGVGGIVQAVPNPEPPMRDQDVEQLHNDRPNPGQPLYLARPLSPPRPAYATPTRHVQQDSTSTNGTARGSTSPSKDSMTSRDALGSVMFIVGRGSGSGPSGGGKEGESNWPIGVEDNNGSDWGTPAKHIHREFTDIQVSTTLMGLFVRANI